MRNRKTRRKARLRSQKKSQFFTRSARSVNSGIEYIDRLTSNIGKSLIGIVHRSAKKTKALTMKVGHNADNVINRILPRRSR